MKGRFPRFVLRRDADDALWWEGELEPIAGVFYRVAVRYPRGYPYSAPTLWLLDPPVEAGAPHLYQDGSLCVHRRGSWLPHTGTAASAVPLLSAWLLAYSVWRVTGERF